MLKVTAPYIRETPVQCEGKSIVLKIKPPGYTIGFRLRHSKQTYHLNVLDAFMAARAQPEKVSSERPKAVKAPVKDSILSVLQAHKRLNIAQVMQQLKQKGMGIDRRMAGEILELLKETGRVKQEGFDYSIAQPKG